NVGQWSTALLAQPGYAPLLHLFEPASYSYAKAVEAMGDRAEVHALAMSSARGEAQLQIIKDGAGVNSLVPVDRGSRPTKTEKVPVDTVDRFSDEHLIPEITLLKIDAEGHDLSVMRGASIMLSRGAIGIVQFEYNWRWVFSRTFLKDVFDLAGDIHRYSVAKV